ncbi:MAG TPA: biotin/lipoyl-containing protein [Flavobacteriales bacterium]|nr:biotin/lipoyl-containing protein [Flavobacteriales bacterium]
MKLEVTLNNDPAKSVETTAKNGNIIINGKTHIFEQVEKGNKHFTVLLDNKSVDVYVLRFERESKKATLLVNGKKCSISASDEMELLLKKLGMDTGTTKKMKELKAPMPGLVVKIEVSAGQEVKKDQAIVILEAMKMENVLKAAADGVVQSIEVNKGQAVEKNQVLIKFN